MTRFAVWMGLGMLLLAPGCTEANPHAGKPGGGDSGGIAADNGGLPTDGLPPGGDAATGKDASAGDAAGGGRILIYVKGDQSKPILNDGLSGQTPRDYQIALSAYHVLRSATDPSPTLCFDHGSKPVVSLMDRDTLVGSCLTSAFQSGAYTHGRTRVDWARFTVDGVYHVAGQAIPTTFTFFRAYSDTTYNGVAYQAGHGFVTAKNFTTVTFPMTYGPLPPMPGVSFQLLGGKFLMTFAYPKPLPIVKSSTETHWARFHWKVGEAFRWQDRQQHNYKAGQWDVNVVNSQSEEVLRHGVLGYNVTSSVDK